MENHGPGETGEQEGHAKVGNATHPPSLDVAGCQASIDESGLFEPDEWVSCLKVEEQVSHE